MLNQYFKRSEFACECGCGMDVVDAELLMVLTVMRVHFMRPTTINSACRCHNHNEHVLTLNNPKYVPNSSKSVHMTGKAADIVVDGISPDVVYDYLISRYPKKFGIGKYRTFTHIDTRSISVRW